jgi:hypothetical protein
MAPDAAVPGLCGRETPNLRSIGYKASCQDGRLPSSEYARARDERFADFVATRIEGNTPPSPRSLRGAVDRAGGRVDRSIRGHRPRVRPV